MFARTLRPALRIILSRCENNTSRIRSYHEPSHLKASTLDDVPIPQGSWQTAFNEKQKKYNMHLIAGVLFVSGTLIVAKASGYFVLNMSPPSLKD